MILTTAEIEWVKERMRVYDIKYQEIYDEVLDHVLTAIEESREAGNTKAIDQLFQNTVDQHFNGYLGIENLAESEARIYQKNIRDAFYQQLKQSFNWKTLGITLLMLTVAFKMPDNKPVHLFFMLIMAVFALAPITYAYAKLTGKVKTIKGKRSLLVTFVRGQMVLPLVFLQGVLYGPNLFDDFNNRKDFYSWNHASPIVLMCGLILLMIVSLSYVQSFNKIVATKIKLSVK
jgi:multisubunit Na+/H+ antiporter MnhG subunit